MLSNCSSTEEISLVSKNMLKKFFVTESYQKISSAYMDNTISSDSSFIHFPLTFTEKKTGTKNWETGQNTKNNLFMTNYVSVIS